MCDGKMNPQKIGLCNKQYSKRTTTSYQAVSAAVTVFADFFGSFGPSKKSICSSVPPFRVDLHLFTVSLLRNHNHIGWKVSFIWRFRQCYQPKQKAEADNANWDLDYYWHHKSKSHNCFIIHAFKEKMTNPLSHWALFLMWTWHFSWKSCIACTTFGFTYLLTGYWIICRVRCFPESTVGY